MGARCVGRGYFDC